jgi:hypothetical protein
MPSAENIDTDIWFVFRRRMLVSRRCVLRPLASACGRLAWGFGGGEMEPWALFQLVSFAYQTASHKGVHHLTWLHFTLILEKLSRTIEIGPPLILGWSSLSQKTFANPSSSLRLFKCICGPSSLFETCYAYPKEQLVLSLGMHKLHTLSVSASLFSSPATFYHGGVVKRPWPTHAAPLGLQSDFLKPSSSILGVSRESETPGKSCCWLSGSS